MPVPQQRPRFGRYRVYDPSASIKRGMKNIFTKRYPNFAPFLGAVYIYILYMFSPPNSWSKKKKKSAIGGEVSHISKPDLDNLDKLVLDACNGIFYKDDCQVCELFSKKIYAEESKTKILLGEK